MARILIIEDDRSAANMLDAVVSVEGYAATIARSAEAALREIQHVGFDLVLLDIGLPGMTGWEVLGTFLHLPKPPPVIVVSGQIDQGDDIKAWSLGAKAVLLKPFNHEELCRTIERVLEQAGQQ